MKTVEVTLAIHVDRDGSRAVLASDDGEEGHAHWIPRSLIESLCPTGRTTKAVKRDGTITHVPVAIAEMAEFKAKELGLI